MPENALTDGNSTLSERIIALGDQLVRHPRYLRSLRSREGVLVRSLSPLQEDRLSTERDLRLACGEYRCPRGGMSKYETPAVLV
ncbi:unnamed protein product [Haemonchus placei]|uniref:Transposase n=1 Tax=Haemonchus placei TaxID=6290 RepID=A0A0N4W4D9_HAEPC|nr:unnamed protein product [Haemonchus placei]